MVVFSKLCAGVSLAAALPAAALHIAKPSSTSSTSSNKDAKVAVSSSAVAQKTLSLSHDTTSSSSSSQHIKKKEDGDEEAWSGADYVADSEEKFPAEKSASANKTPAAVPALSAASPVTEQWDVDSLSCAYGVFTRACPATHFCYKNFAAKETEPPECKEKRLPHMACGVFDSAYWGVVCASEDNPDGSVQKYSCQEVKAGGEEADEPAEEAVAAEEDLFLGGKEGMCKPCCDLEASPDCKEFPECGHDYEESGVDMIHVAESTKICVGGKKGDTVHGCASGPVKLEEDVEEVCVSIADFVAETKDGRFKQVLEEPIPADLEGELHDLMEKMALKKADVCKAPPPKPKAKPAPKPEGKPAPKPKPEPKPEAKPAAKPEPKAKAEPKPKAEAAPDTGAADAAAEAATEKMNRSAPGDEEVPPTTEATEADAVAADSEALAAEFFLKAKQAKHEAAVKAEGSSSQANKSAVNSATKTKETAAAKKETEVKKAAPVIPRTAAEIKRSWTAKAVKTVNSDVKTVKAVSSEVKHAEHVEKAENAVQKVAEILKKPAATGGAAAPATAKK